MPKPQHFIFFGTYERPIS